MNKNIGKEAGKGGKARARKMSKKARHECAQKAAWIRWSRKKESAPLDKESIA